MAQDTTTESEAGHYIFLKDAKREVAGPAIGPFPECVEVMYGTLRTPPDGLEVAYLSDEDQRWRFVDVDGGWSDLAIAYRETAPSGEVVEPSMKVEA